MSVCNIFLRLLRVYYDIKGMIIKIKERL